MARDSENKKRGEKGSGKNNFLPNRNSAVDVIFNPNGGGDSSAVDTLVGGGGGSNVNHLIHQGGHGRQKNNRWGLAQY